MSTTCQQTPEKVSATISKALNQKYGAAKWHNIVGRRYTRVSNEERQTSVCSAESTKGRQD